MRPPQIAQLFLSFYAIQALQESYELPAPRLEPSYPVPRGAALLLRCLGADDSVRYRFYEEAVEEALGLEDSCWESVTPGLRHANATARLAGRYRCHYDFHSFWSPLSPPGDVPVADLYEEPFLWATPRLAVPQGDNVPFHCNSNGDLDKSVLYHGSPEHGFQTLKPHSTIRIEAVIPLHKKTEEITGNYTCKGSMRRAPYFWLAAGDIPGAEWWGPRSWVL